MIILIFHIFIFQVAFSFALLWLSSVSTSSSIPHFNSSKRKALSLRSFHFFLLLYCGFLFLFLLLPLFFFLEFEVETCLQLSLMDELLISCSAYKTSSHDLWMWKIIMIFLFCFVFFYLNYEIWDLMHEKNVPFFDYFWVDRISRTFVRVLPCSFYISILCFEWCT